MVLLAVAYGYCLWRSPFWTTGLTAAVLGLGFALQRVRVGRLRRLAVTRHGGDICAFARSFETRAVDPWVIRAVYEELQRQLNPSCPDFPVLPEDRLREDLRLDDDDLDMDLVPDIATRTGRSLLDPKSNPFYGRVTTVRDLVGFFDAQPRGAA